MLETLKKTVLSLSVIVLFALYAVQEKTRSPLGSSAVVSGSVATVTPRVSGFLPTVTPTASRPVITVTPRGSGLAPTVTPTASRPTTTVIPRVPTFTKTVTPAPSATSPAAFAFGSSGGTTTGASANGRYVDGTYTGSLADANWGNVEVQAIITNGQISDVQFLQYPNHRSRSREINDQAMPMLTQEAIASQQAEVDVVTGATDTSYAFIQSLASALQQAAA